MTADNKMEKKTIIVFRRERKVTKKDIEKKRILKQWLYDHHSLEAMIIALHNIN